jgi:catechol 2,3-dioxygenase-like lactoylglutathione lyase family enzyme
MSILDLQHVQLAMPAGREAEARAFYSGLLGLLEVAKPPKLAARGGCWFEGGTARVHLGVDAAFQPARKAHPALVVDDLEALCLTLRAAGHALEPHTDFPGYRRVYVHDPFGNRLELMEPLP